MTLWKCTLKCKIHGIPDRVEYLRSPNDDRLITMFGQCENIEGSMYYGYKWDSVERMKITDFPEVHTVRLVTKTRESFGKK